MISIAKRTSVFSKLSQLEFLKDFGLNSLGLLEMSLICIKMIKAHNDIVNYKQILFE